MSLISIYLIRTDNRPDFYVEAESYDAAASEANRKINRKGTHARRVTGTPGKSGMYQGYKTQKDRSETTVGPNFHVSEQ